MDPVKIYAPITKVDEDQRLVSGYASTEALDSQGEVIQKDAMEEALPEYMKFANVREMHQPSAVGKAVDVQVDEKGTYITAKVVDEDAWTKVKEGVYNGFSIGGQVLKKVKNVISKIKLTEISLVDRPANPECVFDVVKGVEIEAAEPTTPEVEIEKSDETTPDVNNVEPVETEAVEVVEEVTEEVTPETTETEETKEEVPTVGETDAPQVDVEATETPSVEEAPAEETKEVGDQPTDLKKDIWSADRMSMLAIDLACVIEGYKLEGKETAELETALRTIKDTIIEELKEDENYDWINAYRDVVEAAEQVVDLEKALVEKVKESQKQPGFVNPTELEMPSDEVIAAEMEKQGVEVNEQSMKMAKEIYASQILERVSKAQQAQQNLDAASNEFEAELVKAVVNLTSAIETSLETPQTIEKADPITNDTHSHQPAPHSVFTPDTETVKKGDLTPETDPATRLAKAEERLVKFEAAVKEAEEKIAQLTERLAKAELAPVTPKVKASYVPVERFETPQGDDLAKLEQEIDATSELLKANPHDPALRAKAEALQKRWFTAKRPAQA